MSTPYFDREDRNPFLVQEREQERHLKLAEITSGDLDAERKKQGEDTRKAASAEKAPSTRDATVVNPLSSLNTPTSQFDVTKIPLDKLHQMRRDPMIAFALFFIKAQLMRARWVIECEDAQVAAFVDGALREIYASLVTQYLLKLDYGWSAVVKRFTLSKPDWTYFAEGDSDPSQQDKSAPTGTKLAEDPASLPGASGSGETKHSTGVPQTERKLAWPEGNLLAVTWKPFVPLPPEAADPKYNSAGDFDGMTYKPVKTGPGANTDTKDFDVLHSLWFTNEKDSVWGSLWGYPRIGHAYRFWWSFWFNWGLADRHFEKDADPPAVVYYPSEDDDIKGADGQTRSTRDMALHVGEKARSNSVIALPGETHESFDGTKVGTTRKWSIDFLKGGGNFSVFQERFAQLQVMILKACMVPDEAFAAKGGSAGYNSTGQLQEAFVSSQVVLMDDFDMDLNRFVIPQLVAANFPERVVRVKKVTKSYDVEDLAFAKQLIQLVGQNNPDDLGISIKGLLESVGVPQATPEELAAKQAKIDADLAASKPDPTVPVAGGAATVTEQGFYEQKRNVIELSTRAMSGITSSSAVLLSDLAKHPPLADQVVFTEADQLRTVWQQLVAQDYDEAAKLAQGYEDNLLSQQTEAETFFERWERRSNDRMTAAAGRTQDPIRTVMRRAVEKELRPLGLATQWEPSISDDASNYVRKQGVYLTQQITETTRGELKAFIRDLIKRDTPAKEIPDLVRSHFEMFSSWRADRIVRGEMGQAYNRGVLYAGRENGVTHVQARAGQLGPDRSRPEAIELDGKICTIAEALAIQEKEQPNSTLQWKPIKGTLEIKRFEFSDDSEMNPASLDENGVVWLAENLDADDERTFLKTVVDWKEAKDRDAARTGA
jgi:hypothetical protein